MRLSSYTKHIPSGRLAVEDCILATGRPRGEAKAFHRIFGISHVSAFPAEHSVPAVLTQVLDQLSENADEDTLAPDVLIHVHANPLLALGANEAALAVAASHPLLAEVTQVYEMDQNCCATLFWALEAAQKMLKSGNARAVAIIAGDSFSSFSMRERYMPACTVVGDAFVGLLLDGRETGLQLDDIVLKTNPEFHYGPYGSASEIQDFNRAHTRLVSEVLVELNFPAEVGEPILPHLINRFSWDQYCAATHIKRDNVWLNLLSDLGHCCTTDAFLNLDRFMEADGLDSAVLVAIGQGGFVSGCRVKKPATGGQHATG
jgi:3-oxoacyl-[acyl-carrier-protein] synthase-3